jgi:hypothetical protein
VRWDALWIGVREVLRGMEFGDGLGLCLIWFGLVFVCWDRLYTIARLGVLGFQTIVCLLAPV